MSNDGTKSTFNIITAECQTMVQRGGMVNILTVEGTINILTVKCQMVVRRGAMFNIITAEWQTVVQSGIRSIYNCWMWNVWRDGIYTFNIFIAEQWYEEVAS